MRHFDSDCLPRQTVYSSDMGFQKEHAVSLDAGMPSNASRSTARACTGYQSSIQVRIMSDQAHQHIIDIAVTAIGRRLFSANDQDMRCVDGDH